MKEKIKLEDIESYREKILEDCKKYIHTAYISRRQTLVIIMNIDSVLLNKKKDKFILIVDTLDLSDFSISKIQYSHFYINDGVLKEGVEHPLTKLITSDLEFYKKIYSLVISDEWKLLKNLQPGVKPQDFINLF